MQLEYRGADGSNRQSVCLVDPVTFLPQNYSPGHWGKGVLWAPALAKPDGIQVGDVEAGTALKALFVP